MHACGGSTYGTAFFLLHFVLPSQIWLVGAQSGNCSLLPSGHRQRPARSSIRDTINLGKQGEAAELFGLVVATATPQCGYTHDVGMKGPACRERQQDVQEFVGDSNTKV